jgi:putative endonuclease
MFYVYVLESRDDQKEIYIGHTSDLKRRIDQHNSRNNKGYTRGRSWRLAYYEAYSSSQDSRRRERRLKDDGRSRTQLMNRIKESLSG